MNLNRKIYKYMKIRPNDIPPYTGHWKMKRVDLIKIFQMAGFKRGAEIGVNKGQHSEIMCKMIPDLNITCVDPWKKYFPKDSQGRQDSAFEEAKRRLNPYNAKLIKMTSVEASRYIADESLDFVYIDGNHQFDHTITDLITWSAKVKIGGIISGHDYVQHYDFGVIEAVNAYTRAHHVDPWFIIKGRQSTYLWVKKHHK